MEINMMKIEPNNNVLAADHLLQENESLAEKLTVKDVRMHNQFIVKNESSSTMTEMNNVNGNAN